VWAVGSLKAPPFETRISIARRDEEVRSSWDIVSPLYGAKFKACENWLRRQAVLVTYVAVQFPYIGLQDLPRFLER
jgi:hypothetical protein